MYWEQNCSTEAYRTHNILRHTSIECTPKLPFVWTVYGGQYDVQTQKLCISRTMGSSVADIPNCILNLRQLIELLYVVFLNKWIFVCSVFKTSIAYIFVSCCAFVMKKKIQFWQQINYLAGGRSNQMGWRQFAIASGDKSVYVIHIRNCNEQFKFNGDELKRKSGTTGR